MLTMFEGAQLIFFVAILFLLFKVMGEYIDFILEPTRPSPVFYRVLRIRNNQEQTWKQYLGAILVFSIISGVGTLFLLLFQSHLPLNPERLPDIPFPLAFNIAISFLTNTDWQAYGGESTLSYFSQIMALGVQNFFSPAVGLCAAAALCRGLFRENTQTLGNFWIDLTRIIVYLLLPLAVIVSIFFMQQGTPQNFSPYLDIQTLQGALQKIVQGPLASQEAIKVLGTNGGGFTHVNSAHPYENPTMGTNFFQMMGFFLIVLGQLYYFGKRIRCMKTIWTFFFVIVALLVFQVILCTSVEKQGLPFLQGIDTSMGNLEGKEMRFGVFGSCFYLIASSFTSCGAVNAIVSSFTPAGKLFSLLNIEFGKTLFGGVGMGVCNMALFALLICSCAGFLRGRTPRYVGKSLEFHEIFLAFLPFCFFYLAILGFVAATGRSTGLSEVIYAYSSAAGNNGSSATSLPLNSSWYNYTLACAMLLGRFGTLVPVLALAGALGKKKKISGAELFPLKGVALSLLLISAVLVLGIIVFLPSLLLGPLLDMIQYWGKA